jgi:hypothetical protein
MVKIHPPPKKWLLWTGLQLESTQQIKSVHRVHKLITTFLFDVGFASFINSKVQIQNNIQYDFFGKLTTYTQDDLSILLQGELSSSMRHV